MAGLGKLLKTAQKMQQSMGAIEAEIEKKEFDVTSGGGALRLKVNGAGKFLSFSIEPELMKEDPKLVSDMVLAAFQDAANTAKQHHDAELKKVTSAFQMPGLF